MNKKIRATKRRDLARAISVVEDGGSGAETLLENARRAERVARVIGITGPPGVGKSTLVDRLSEYIAQSGERVAILAVDPSSSFTGGAVLGDRIRMDRIANQPEIYLRSLSARGEIGGLNAAASDIITLLNAYGFTRIIVETVGAGQSDIEIMAVADAVIVALAPGMGDHVQAAKAGIMEIADIFAINKFDLSGAEVTMAQIELSVHVSHSLTEKPDGWIPPVRAVSALSGDGIETLSSAIDAYLASAESSGRVAHRRRGRIEAQLRRLLSDRLLHDYLEAHGETLAMGIECISEGKISPTRFVDQILAQTSNHI